MEMIEYFVTHPELDISALVRAPSTEKARTTYLDYLERRGIIHRSSRGYYRENMIAERMNESYPVQADVELSYGYSDSSPIRFKGSHTSSLIEESREEPYFTNEEGAETPFVSNRSPIQQAATRGFI